MRSTRWPMPSNGEKSTGYWTQTSRASSITLTGHGLCIYLVIGLATGEYCLVQKWLNAGILEAGELSDSLQGTPQGAPISPLLANVYLHNVIDSWFGELRPTRTRGEVYIVRYADDFVLGFQYRSDIQNLEGYRTD